ncbi:MAG: peptidoglycan binding domain-containing protein, partial [Lachnospiraceae bacterium]|nr:peptidoglycan binding domain-containing protein [Candidatus Minthocola equi]
MKTAKWLTIALSMGIVFAATVACADTFAPVVFAETEEEKTLPVIYDGVTIDGVSVGGMTLDKAENTVHVADSAMLSRSVSFTLNGKEVSTTWRSFGIKFDETGVFEKAMAIGKSDGSMVGRFKALADIKAEGTALETVISCDEDTIQKYLTSSLAGLDGSPVDAQLVHEGDTFTIIPSVDGIVVDAEKTSETVLALINERKFDTK